MADRECLSASIELQANNALQRTPAIALVAVRKHLQSTPLAGRGALSLGRQVS